MKSHLALALAGLACIAAFGQTANDPSKKPVAVGTTRPAPRITVAIDDTNLVKLGGIPFRWRVGSSIKAWRGATYGWHACSSC